jgi:hypothetical protein
MTEIIFDTCRRPEVMFGVVYCGTLSSKGGKQFFPIQAIPQSFWNTLQVLTVLVYLRD